jgi:hypothetical protein
MKNSDNTSNETTEKIQSRTWNPLRLAVLKVRHYSWLIVTLISRSYTLFSPNS